MKKERIGFIDVAKGLAMLLVVYGHNPLPEGMLKVVYLLNVPIFFLMSGYTFKAEKYESFFCLVKKLAKRVLVPYIVMNILALPVYYITRERAIDIAAVKEFIVGVIYGSGAGTGLKCNIPLWFLPCIFAVQCLWYPVCKYAKKAKGIFVLAFSLIGFFIYPVLKIRLPWGIDVAFTGIVFFAAGGFIRAEKVQKFIFKIPSLVGFLIMISLSLLLNSLNRSALPNVDVNAMVFGNYFLFYLSTFSGCFAMIYLAKLLEKSKILSYVGRNTMWILGLHSIFIQFFELTLKLNFVSDQRLNSFVLAVLEIGCVVLIRLIYDALKNMAQKKFLSGVN
ncbi:MAG: acyltransferase family protein [Clostridia bacterium]|nr:acyltransferase family protein [Clostridia bacterium]